MGATGGLDSNILRAYDIRGIVGQTLQIEDAFAIGRAFATVSAARLGRQPKLCVGYDGRLSSPDLEAALVSGLVSSGADVLRSGLGPTPMLYFAVKKLDRDGGVMVTGSHNPPDFNGFKLMLSGLPFWDQDIQILGKIISDADFADRQGTAEKVSVENDYVERLSAEYTSNQPLSVAWDAGNGAAGKVIDSLVNRLPGDHLVLNSDIDGTFPSHHPDPTIPENLDQLISAVVEHSCDFGVGFDGDGDRIGVVDNKGRIVWGDQLLTLYAIDLLQDMPGASIIADVKSSLVFFQEVAAHGGKPVMWRTGHSPIKSKMMELNSPLAGEMSGHIFFADRYYGYDDAVYAAVRLLDLIARSKCSLETLCDQLPTTFHTPEVRFPCDDVLKFQIIDSVRERLEDMSGIEVNSIDGVRVTTSDGWWLLRASNTEPVLVARCEAEDANGLVRLKAMLREQLSYFGLAAPIK